MTVRWTDSALEDLRRIQAHVEHHSPQYAMALVERIFDRTELLTDYPRLGQVVPEFERESIRELLESSYRILYLVDDDAVDILAVIHAARRLPSRLGEVPGG